MSRHQLHAASHNTQISLPFLCFLCFFCTFPLFFSLSHFHNSVVPMIWPLRLVFDLSLPSLSRHQSGLGVVLWRWWQWREDAIKWLNQQQPGNTKGRQVSKNVSYKHANDNFWGFLFLLLSCSLSKNANGLFVRTQQGCTTRRQSSCMFSGSVIVTGLQLREDLTTARCPHCAAIMFLIVKQRYTTMVW